MSNLHEIILQTGKWLVLATANYMLSEFGDVLDEKDYITQRAKQHQELKDIYRAIDLYTKWDELKTGVPMSYE